MAGILDYRKTLKRELTVCPRCGGGLSLNCEPYHSRIATKCAAEGCGYSGRRRVRASALSLFGVVRLSGYLLWGACVAIKWYDPSFSLSLIAVAILFLLGAAGISFLVRVIAVMVMQSNLPLTLREDAVSHLVPLHVVLRTSVADESPESETHIERDRAHRDD
jgi:hypothetical protein